MRFYLLLFLILSFPSTYASDDYAAFEAALKKSPKAREALDNFNRFIMESILNGKAQGIGQTKSFDGYSPTLDILHATLKDDPAFKDLLTPKRGQDLEWLLFGASLKITARSAILPYKSEGTCGISSEDTSAQVLANNDPEIKILLYTDIVTNFHICSNRTEGSINKNAYQKARLQYLLCQEKHGICDSVKQRYKENMNPAN